MTDEEDFSVNLASIEIPFKINRELLNELSAPSPRITSISCYAVINYII